MTTLELTISLPDELASKARAAGLLSSESMEKMLREQLRKQAGQDLLAMTVGADKAYDTESFVEDCREINVTPHVAQNTSGRASRIDGRTTRHAGYRISQFARKLLETVFGDAKQHGILRQVKLRGLAKVELLFTLAATVVNLRRLPKLLAIHPSG